MGTLHTAEILRQRLEQATAGLGSSGDWLDALGWAARLRAFSFGNALLVRDQWGQRQVIDRAVVAPSMLATRPKWRSLGGRVRAGQCGYPIFTQGAVLVVWDISQLQVPPPQLAGQLSRQKDCGLSGQLRHLIEHQNFLIVDSPGGQGGVDWRACTVLVEANASQVQQVSSLAIGFADMWLNSAGWSAGDPVLARVAAQAAGAIVVAAHGWALDQHPASRVDWWAGQDVGRHQRVLQVGQLARTAGLAILDWLDNSPGADGSVRALDGQRERTGLIGQLGLASALPAGGLGW